MPAILAKIASAGRLPAPDPAASSVQRVQLDIATCRFTFHQDHAYKHATLAFNRCQSTHLPEPLRMVLKEWYKPNPRPRHSEVR